MTIALNQLDYAIAGIIALGAVYGLARGGLRMATSILSFAAGAYAASMFYHRVAEIARQRLGLGPDLSVFVAYVAIFAIAFGAVTYAGGKIIRLAHLMRLNWIDRLGGALFGAAIAFAFAGVDILILAAFLPANTPLLHDSKFAPRVLAYDQALIGYVPPQYKHLYEEKRAELDRDFNQVSEDPATSPDDSKSAK